MGYIRRHLEDRVLRLSQSFPAILITGPRQAGKTTMLRMLTKKENTPRTYVTLDDLVARDGHPGRVVDVAEGHGLRAVAVAPCFLIHVIDHSVSSLK